MKPVKCDYCGKPAELVTGDVIYPHRADLFDKFFHKCTPCNAYVGCHPNTNTPMGRLAKASLRKLKSKAHSAFDPIWQNNPELTRNQAYAWLAIQMGIPKDKCHIGMFNEDQCKKAIEMCNRKAASGC